MVTGGKSAATVVGDETLSSRAPRFSDERLRASLIPGHVFPAAKIV